jgi:holo-[acyl-carrier protein] synthase
LHKPPVLLYKNSDMVYGIGIDIVKVARIKEVSEKWGDRFLKRVFTKDELAYCFRKISPYLSLAVRFAAKEAFIKAISSEVSVSFTDIEVTNTGSGQPVLRLNEKLEAFLRTKGIIKTHLSLSHEHEYGVACVVLET